MKTVRDNIIKHQELIIMGLTVVWFFGMPVMAYI